VSNYCTYFDRGYLAQGLAMWRSLEQHDAAAVLWVLALDDETAGVMRARGGRRLRVLTLPELLAADPGLAAVQAARPRHEFIFTLTPCLVRHLWRSDPEAGPLAYLDADLCFFANPTPVWAALDGSSVLVVEHRFPGWHDDAWRVGRFNVGVLAFRPDAAGKACVEWWRARCLESCAMTTDGRIYGDQKYLDEWPRMFDGVVALAHPGVNLAPWNWAAFDFTLSEEAVQVDGHPLVVFHFAQFRRISTRWFDSGQLEYGIMPLRLRSRLYGAYWRRLEVAEREIRTISPDFSLPVRGWRASLGAWHLALLRLCWGQFWVRVGPWWLAGRLGIGRWSGRVMAIYRRQHRGAS
jgi:hypothetical protein